MNIVVYLGSSTGNRPAYRQAAEELGTWMGRSGHALIYGGSRTGLMGVLADAVLAQGGRAIGIEPRFFVEEEIQHPGLTELIVTDTMADRKQRMMELGDAFVTFPGGIGTMEEILEAMTLAKLGRLNKPFCFLNILGYYEPLRKLLHHMAAEGFLEEEWVEEVPFLPSVEEMARYVMSAGKIR